MGGVEICTRVGLGMAQKEEEPEPGGNNCRMTVLGHSTDDQNSDSLLDFEPRATDTVFECLLARELAEPESDG